MSGSLLQAFSESGDPRVLLDRRSRGLRHLHGGRAGVDRDDGRRASRPGDFLSDPISALAAVVTVEACAIFAGDIPNALLRIPGTPARPHTPTTLMLSPRRPLRGGSRSLPCVLRRRRRVGHGDSRAVCPAIGQYHHLVHGGGVFLALPARIERAVIVSRGSTWKAAFALIIGLLLSTVGLSCRPRPGPIHLRSGRVVSGD